MSGGLVLEAEALGKAFPVHAGRFSRFAQLAFGLGRAELHWAVKDISLSLSRGEALGIVGRNGAGKSTLLQMLCGIQKPTAGEVRRHGRIAAMLQLGAGFRADFTGRENAFLCASIYGLSRSEIEERFDRIAAFADIGAYLDRPVREYSSGMFARLAFAVCAHVEADILVIDEVLSVGDAHFQLRCRRFIDGFLDSGAVLFVSHNDETVMKICNRAIWMERGEEKAQGEPQHVIGRYRAMGSREDDVAAPAREAIAGRGPELQRRDSRYGRNAIAISPFADDAVAHGHGGAAIDGVFFRAAQGERVGEIQGGDEVTLVIEGSADREVASPIVGFILRDAGGQNLFGDNTYTAYRALPVAIAAGGRFQARLTFRMPYLPVGRYTVAPSIIEGTQASHVQLHWIEEALVLTVNQSPLLAGHVGVPIVGHVREVPVETVPSGGLGEETRLALHPDSP